MTTAVKPVSIQTFVEGLRQLPESAFGPTEPVRRFLQDTPVSAESLAPYLNWDRQHYTRNLIDRTSLYELMAICWEVGQASSVHNHRDQNCWMAVPIGRLQVENYHLVHQGPGGRHLPARTDQHCGNEYLAALRRGSRRPRASRRESAGIQPSRGQPACILAAFRHLRGVLSGAGNVRGDSAPLQYRIRQTEVTPNRSESQTPATPLGTIYAEGRA